MPKETHLAARRSDGAALYYHDSPYPTKDVVEMFEHYHKGAAKDLLEMVRREQAAELKLSDRNSSLEYVTRILGMCFAFVLALAIIAGGIILICHNHEVTGCITLFTGLLGIIGCLATGGKQPPVK
ncbi:MAG: hypothetical protein ACI4RD_03020 [Kiritimatiellia bacterium]